MLAAGIATASVIAAGGAVHGAFHRNSPVFGRVLSELPEPAGGAPTVALTFDDGPNPEATPRILDALGEAGVPATFFVLGRHAERWPELVARAVAEGHEVANHGYFHRKLHDRSPGYVRRDLSLGTTALDRAAGVRARFFRAPHGFRSPWVTSIARSLGQRTVGWTLGVWDSARPGVDAIVRRTVDGARARAILLLHDGDGYDPAGDRLQTAAALPRIVAELRDRGFTFAALPR
ncbi:MAG TPA: polysaccharide deacetylase family protein [Gemmatimonadaceae bacterium]|nr:polysaccharide deacetylase family protein [Gemmatimonadaceae bacterium]